MAHRLGIPISLLLAEDDGPQGKIGVEAKLLSAIKRTEELEAHAVKTRSELRLALAAVRKLVEATPR